MHIGLIHDEERIAREQSMLHRLIVGLIDEGAQITRLSPQTVNAGDDDAEQSIALATRVEYAPRVLPWLHRSRIERLREAFERSRPDILLACGQQTWPIVMPLAKAIDRPVAIEIWSVSQISVAARLRPRQQIAAYLAATEPMANELRGRVPSELVGCVPQGVPVPRKARSVLRDDAEAIGIVCLGTCSDLRAYANLLPALAEAVHGVPQIHVFLELDGPREHQIWRLVRQHGLADRITSIQRAAEHRDLLTDCDMILLPEQTGTASTLVLEAMANQLPIIARFDPFLDDFVHERTALLVQDGVTREWLTAIERLLTQREFARVLGRNGREWIEEHHRSSAQASQLYRILTQALNGSALPFKRPEGTDGP